MDESVNNIAKENERSPLTKINPKEPSGVFYSLNIECKITDPGADLGREEAKECLAQIFSKIEVNGVRVGEPRHTTTYKLNKEAIIDLIEKTYDNVASLGSCYIATNKTSKETKTTFLCNGSNNIKKSPLSSKMDSVFRSCR